MNDYYDDYDYGREGFNDTQLTESTKKIHS